MTEFVLLVVLGVVLTLDGVTVGQFMMSRPLVAGGLAGVVLGDAPTGFLVGAVLELFLLVTVPSGAGRYPEPGHASVVGVAGAVWVPGAPGLALGVALALVLGYVGAVTQTVQRRANRRWVPDPAEEPVTARGVTRGHWLSVAVDGARGGLLTLAGLLVVRGMASWAGPAWPLSEAETRGLLLVGAFVSLGIMGRALVSRSRWVLMAAGALVGILLGVGVAS